MTAAPEEGRAFAHPGRTAEKGASAPPSGLNADWGRTSARPQSAENYPSRNALLTVEITCQGQLTPLMAKGGLETNCDNFAI